MADKKILIVEDDADLRRMARDVLAKEWPMILEAETGAQGWGLFQAQKPDLVILDIQLPDMTGVEVCRKIRDHAALFATPVIMLTGLGKLEEKEAGFEAGADQYLVKPLSPRELLLWAQALLRRQSFDKEEGDVLKAGDLEIDLSAHLVRFQGRTTPNLTAKEFELLYYLVKHRPKVFSRKQILSNLWHTIAVDQVVNTHISNLRKKLPPEAAGRLQSVSGKGFRYFG